MYLENDNIAKLGATRKQKAAWTGGYQAHCHEKNLCLQGGEGGQSPARSSSNTDGNRPFLHWSHSIAAIAAPSSHTQPPLRGNFRQCFPLRRQDKLSPDKSFIFSYSLSCYRCSGIGYWSISPPWHRAEPGVCPLLTPVQVSRKQM